MTEELLTEDEKRRVAKMATEEAIDKIKQDPRFKALSRLERRKLLRSFRNK